MTSSPLNPSSFCFEKKDTDKSDKEFIIRGMMAIQLLFLIIGLESVFSLPSFGFNLPPLGIEGKNVDYRETSPRFFAGEGYCYTKYFSNVVLTFFYRPFQTLNIDEGEFLLRR